MNMENNLYKLNTKLIYEYIVLHIIKLKWDKNEIHKNDSIYIIFIFIIDGSG